MKDLRIIVRYSGKERLPTKGVRIIGHDEEEHVVKIVMGFVGEPTVQAFEHRSDARLPALMYPDDEAIQVSLAIGEAIRGAAEYFEQRVVQSQPAAGGQG